MVKYFAVNQVLDRVSVNDTTVIDILVFYGNFQIFLLMEELLHGSFMLSARGIYRQVFVVF